MLHHSYLLHSYLLLGDLPKRHMWGVFHISFIGFPKLNIVFSVTIFTLGFRLFFNLLQINYNKNYQLFVFIIVSV